MKIRVRRFEQNPIIRPDMDRRMGTNINGPSLIRVPEWVAEPLGNYYLYFADHKGSYIRLAYADSLTGPWAMHEPGTLSLSESPFLHEPPETPDNVDRSTLDQPRAPNVASVWDDCTIPHVASPDVHAVEARREVRMYYHGLDAFGVQVTRVATSADGIHFTAHAQVLGNPYLRVFAHAGETYAIAMPGQFYRSADGLTDFEPGPKLFERNMRHAALLKRGDRLWVFWTRVGDAPERILLSTIDLGADWSEWRESEPVEVLRPEHSWEGADAPLQPSVRSSIGIVANQLRDPAIYEEDGRCYLLYAIGGEAGIAIAELSTDGGLLSA
jgi:hypothetical protein